MGIIEESEDIIIVVVEGEDGMVMVWIIAFKIVDSCHAKAESCFRVDHSLLVRSQSAQYPNNKG